MVIGSAKKNNKDWYTIEYEQVPRVCFSCGCLGHFDLFCPTSGTRDETSDLPLKSSLGASEDCKRASSDDSSTKERQET